MDKQTKLIMYYDDMLKQFVVVSLETDQELSSSPESNSENSGQSDDAVQNTFA